MLEATIVGFIVSVLIQLSKKYVELARQYPKVLVVVLTAIGVYLVTRLVASTALLLWAHSIASAIMAYEMLVKPVITSSGGH